MKTILSYLKIFGLLLAAYLLFGAGAWLMPDGSVDRHIARTLDQGDLSSDQPRAFMPRQQCRMDNFTDALILNQAKALTSENLLDGILLLPRKSANGLPFEDLRAYSDGNQEMYTIHYGRYWHGNTFLTRYLLVFYDYISIRLLLYIVSSLLLAWCIMLLWRKGGWQTAMAVLFGLLVCYAFMMQFSIQFIPVFLLALSGMVALARSDKPASRLFFVIGSLTCFFDLLTAPMLTLGLMLVVQAALVRDDAEQQPAQTLKGWWLTLRSSLLWVAGYAATWACKWIIATLLTSENVIADGIKKVGSRSDVLEDYGRWDAVMANFDMLPWQFIILAMLLLVVLVAVSFRAQGWRKAVQLLPIALLPWMWYFFAANHSYLHNWFTFRAQAVSIAALLLTMMQFVDWSKLKNLSFKAKH